MTASTKKNILIILGILALITAVVVYIIFPLHQERLNKAAVEAEAESYYYDRYVSSGQAQLDSAQAAIDGQNIMDAPVSGDN